jgi:hypothetical protein
MEGYCSTGQSPQCSVVPVEEEEEEGKISSCTQKGRKGAERVKLHSFLT